MLTLRNILPSVLLLLFLLRSHASTRGDHDHEEVKDFISRIVGGENAPKDLYPWFARPVKKGTNRWAGCGGTLIAPEFVLTAGHCDMNKDKHGYQIAALCPDEDDNCGQEGLEYFDIKDVITHPEHSGVANDVALVHLNGQSKNKYADIDEDNIGAEYASGYDGLFAIGFGTTSYDGWCSDELLHVQLKYVTDAKCKNMYGGDVAENELCAQDLGKDSCQGDSGGPLFDKNNEKLVGVVSWGIGCAEAKHPGVYAQVGSHVQWIKSIICTRHGDPKPSFCDGYSPPPTSSPTIYECDGTPFKFEIKFDKYPQDISWKIEDACNEAVVASSDGNYSDERPQSRLVHRECLTKETKFKFIIEDSYGDGLTDSCIDCGYKIFYNDTQVGEGEKFGKGETHNFGLFSCGPAEPTQSPTESPSSSPSTFECDGKPFGFEIKFDKYPADISWQVHDLCNDKAVVASSDGDYSNAWQYSTLRKKECLTEESSFRFILKDTYEDGLTFNCDDCEYKIHYDGIQIGQGSDFGKKDTHDFGKPKSRCGFSKSCVDRTDVGNTCTKIDTEDLKKMRKKCSKKANDNYVYDVCPFTCNLCGEDCVDNAEKFKWKNDKKDKCKNLANKCNKPTVAINCPKTCNKCYST